MLFMNTEGLREVETQEVKRQRWMGRVQQAAGVLGIGLSILTGMWAINAEHEAVRAEAIAEVYEAQGNPQADQWEIFASHQKTVRNTDLGLTAVNLALAGVNYFGGTGIVAAARRTEEESQIDQADHHKPS